MKAFTSQIAAELKNLNAEDARTLRGWVEGICEEVHRQAVTEYKRDGAYSALTHKHIAELNALLVNLRSVGI